MFQKKYGVVYTPKKLADFVARLLFEEIVKEGYVPTTILDPACGGCALLDAAKNTFQNRYLDIKYIGIDVDCNIQTKDNEFVNIINADTILPKGRKTTTVHYWRNKIGNISVIIANPPWSSEKIYQKNRLEKAGFSLIDGQYDSYVLFLEFALNVLDDGGYFAFIIPDSIFDAQNEQLRLLLLQNTEIKVIARLGEKLFPNVNRSTTVIVCRKIKPTENSKTMCFRLSTENRKEYLTTDKSLMTYYLGGVHSVLQNRFLRNDSHNFNIDARSEEESILKKICQGTISISDIFIFGRGVEISKLGNVVECQKCGNKQAFTREQLVNGWKYCSKCKEKIIVSPDRIEKIIYTKKIAHSSKIYVGEDIHRYIITNNHFILLNINGINYKSQDLYDGDKLLIRKTGMGIYCVADRSNTLTNQTVYILKQKRHPKNKELYYYLGLLNSRVIYYFYLKMYGENEWKSHPYLTKKIIHSFPIKKYENKVLDNKIIELAETISTTYDYKLDIELEKLIMKKYLLNKDERQIIINEMDKLPNLQSVANMKVRV